MVRIEYGSRPDSGTSRAARMAAATLRLAQRDKLMRNYPQSLSPCKWQRHDRFERVHCGLKTQLPNTRFSATPQRGSNG